MFYYAVIEDGTGICFNVEQSETAISNPNYIQIDSLDQSYLYRKKYVNGAWVNTTIEEAQQFNGHHIGIFGKWLDEALTEIEEGAAPVDHTHTEYAAASHEHSGYAAVSHTHDYAASGHTHTPASIGAAAASHTHDYAATSHTHTPASIGAAAASHTHTNNIIVEQTGSPYLRLKLADVACEARVYKNASTTADYGLTLADYDNDGAKDSLIFCRKNALDKKLYLNIQNDDDTRSLYYLYGEHHKPTADEVGALALTGGTVTGETNFSGGLVRLKGVQTLYHSGTQLVFGSNNLPTRIGGTAITATQTIQVDSDERLKENVAPVDAEACCALIKDIDVKTFNYIGNDGDCMGVIAQELENNELAKFFVTTGPEGYKAVKEAGMVWPTIVALQKALKRIDDLEAKVATLEAHKCNCK